MDCVIERTDFQGMILQYGIWKRGDLVEGLRRSMRLLLSRDRSQCLRKRTGTCLDQHHSLCKIRGLGWKAAEAVYCPYMSFVDDG